MIDLSKKKAVIWDLDDTLCRRTEAARKTFPGMFAENIYTDRSEDFLREAARYMIDECVPQNNMIHEDAFRSLFKKYPADKPFDHAACVEYYFDHLPDFITPFENEVEAVKKLRDLGLKTAILTNVGANRIPFQKRKIGILGISPLFDAIVYSGEVGISKPDARIFEHTASLLGVSCEECIFVGDDPTADVMGALGVGMDVIWLDRNNDPERFSDDPRVHRADCSDEWLDI